MILWITCTGLLSRVSMTSLVRLPIPVHSTAGSWQLGSWRQLLASANPYLFLLGNPSHTCFLLLINFYLVRAQGGATPEAASSPFSSVSGCSNPEEVRSRLKSFRVTVNLFPVLRLSGADAVIFKILEREGNLCAVTKVLDQKTKASRIRSRDQSLLYIPAEYTEASHIIPHGLAGLNKRGELVGNQTIKYEGNCEF